MQFMDEFQNITQEQMAIFLGVSQQYVSLLINNRVVPRINKIQLFARKTHTELSFWLVSSGDQKEQAIKKAMVNSKGVAA